MTVPFRPEFLARFNSAPEIDATVALPRPRLWAALFAIAFVVVQLSYVLFGFAFPKRIILPASIVSSAGDGSAILHIDFAGQIDPTASTPRGANWISSGSPAIPCTILSWRKAASGNGWDVSVRSQGERSLEGLPRSGWLRVIHGSTTILSKSVPGRAAKAAQ
jgi:hypothetical protein